VDVEVAEVCIVKLTTDVCVAVKPSEMEEAMRSDSNEWALSKIVNARLSHAKFE